jgi:diacylglycerol kinase family enzyme
VLFYDRPFGEMESKWSNRMAELMLEGARVGRRIVIVAGVTKIPSVWQQCKEVRIENGAATQFQRTAVAQGRSAELGGQMRNLRRENGESKSPGVFITRPQTIQRKPNVLNESVKAEAIENPHVSVGERIEALSESSGKSRRLSESGKLTRVTGSYKIKRTSAYLRWRKVLRALKSVVGAQPVRHATPIEGRLHLFRRGEELKFFLLLLLVLLACLLIVRFATT